MPAHASAEDPGSSSAAVVGFTLLFKRGFSPPTSQCCGKRTRLLIKYLGPISVTGIGHLEKRTLTSVQQLSLNTRRRSWDRTIRILAVRRRSSVWRQKKRKRSQVAGQGRKKSGLLCVWEMPGSHVSYVHVDKLFSDNPVIASSFVGGLFFL